MFCPNVWFLTIIWLLISSSNTPNKHSPRTWCCPAGSDITNKIMSTKMDRRCWRLLLSCQQSISCPLSPTLPLHHHHLLDKQMYTPAEDKNTQFNIMGSNAVSSIGECTILPITPTWFYFTNQHNSLLSSLCQEGNTTAACGLCVLF